MRFLNTTKNLQNMISLVAAMLLLAVVGLPVVSVAGESGPDSDGDGIINQHDQDDDNDGVLDVYEGVVDVDGDGIPDSSSTDTDGDGTPDVLDLDSDNDGILDLTEVRLNRADVMALDQVPNGAIDISFAVGSNGIADVIETAADSGQLIYDVPDTDGDSIPDFRDNDSDNDGIYDVIEAGATDYDTDGRIDGFYDADGKGVADAIQFSGLPLFDTDGDGSLDFRDSDSDNDTIPDSVEGGSSPSFPTDTDGDGAFDYREYDSDNDGINDSQEAGNDPFHPVDTDGDGFPDYQDAVNDGDGNEAGGSNEATDTSNGPDTDGDHIANQYDLDDDNDGIPDIEEGAIDIDGDGVLDAGSRDSDGDGTPDAWDLDSDNDGMLDLYESRADLILAASLDQVRNGAIDIGIEVGANGLADVVETSPDAGGINFVLVDTDADGLPDYLDIDSDGDGIPDLVEGGGTDADCNGQVDNFTDADAKGVDDGIGEGGLILFDTDADGQHDFRDTDSDNDGAADRDEAGPNPCDPLDSDGDGADDYREFGSGSGPNSDSPSSDDVDNDGIPNGIDMDDDNDGLMDDVEGSQDIDSDSVQNSHDLDSDNDGVFDSQEAAVLLEIIGSLDKNNDGQVNEVAVGANGYADALETSPDSGVPIFIVADTDGDGVPDFADLDSDNDSIVDTRESNYPDPDNDGRLDTVVNALGLAIGAGNSQIDSDGDSIVDRRDLDTDNDGLPDLIEARGVDIDGDGRIDGFSDSNFDGLDDGVANASPGAIDTDGDSIADFRDLDSDQDSLSDLLETRGASLDSNNDGVLDSYTDANGDGYDDALATQPLELLDPDRDGLPNHVDSDSDNDGKTDLEEVGGVDQNNDGKVDGLADVDGDGIPDSADVDQAGGSDSDGDGIADAADVDNVGGLDSDGDGIADSADPDSNGDGMVGPSNDGTGQGNPLPVPDTDANGIPDFQESDGTNELISSGNGCQVGTTEHSDVSFLLLLMVAAGISFRRQRKRVLYATTNRR